MPFCTSVNVMQQLTSRTSSGIQPSLSGVTLCNLMLYARNFQHPLTAMPCNRSGEGRITIFASESNAQTFDFVVSAYFTFSVQNVIVVLHLQPGDVGYVPPSFGEPPVAIIQTKRLTGEYPDRSLCREYRQYDPQIPRNIQSRFGTPLSDSTIAC